MTVPMKRLDKLLQELGYCRRKTLRQFFKNHEVQVEGKDLRKMRKNALVDWRDVRINGRPLEYVHPLHIMLNKPKAMRSTDAEGYAAYYRGGQESVVMDVLRRQEDNAKAEVLIPSGAVDVSAPMGGVDGVGGDAGVAEMVEEDEGELFDVLPPLFVFRMPRIKIYSPLADDASGLTFMTQNEELIKRLSSIRTPLKRVYEVQVRQNYTGLENDALQLFRSGIKPSVKNVIPSPRFNIVDEENRIAHIVLYDYKPDNVLDMLISMRHDPVKITRIGLGNLILATDTTLALHERIRDMESDPDIDNRLLRLNDADWMELNEERLSILMQPQQKIIEKRRQMKMEKERQYEDKPVIHVSTVVKNISRAEHIDLDNVRISGHVGKPKEYAKFTAGLLSALADGEEEEEETSQGDGKMSQRGHDDFMTSKAKMDSIFDGSDDRNNNDNDDNENDDDDEEDDVFSDDHDVDGFTDFTKRSSSRRHRRMMYQEDVDQDLPKIGGKLRTITELHSKEKVNKKVKR